MRVARALFLILLLCVSCTEGNPDASRISSEGHEVLTDQPHAPLPGSQEAVLVTFSLDMPSVWRHYRLEGDVPNLNDGEEVALFVGTGESGTCPIEIKDITVTSEEVEVQTAQHDGVCTSDFVFRTFVFLFPSAHAPAVGATVSIEGSGLEIEAAGTLLH